MNRAGATTCALLVALAAAGCSSNNGGNNGYDGGDSAIEAHVGYDTLARDITIDSTRDQQSLELGGDVQRDAGPDARLDATGLDVTGLDAGCTTALIEAEDSTKVTRSGNWAVSSGAALHGGAGLESSSFYTGEKLTLSFVGTGLTVYYESGPSRGAFDVSIDGQAAVHVNTYAAGTYTFQVPAVVGTGLQSGTHSAELTDVSPAQTTPVTIDFFRATCN